MASSGDDLTREVNRLYWETEIPVTDLSERLGVSRGTLYNHTQPLPAGAECGRCGGALAYRNRQAREAGEASCVECGAARKVPPRPALSRGSSSTAARPRSKAAAPASGRAQRIRTAAASADAGDLAVLFAAITVGVGLIAAGAMLLGRRS